MERELAVGHINGVYLTAGSNVVPGSTKHCGCEKRSSFSLCISVGESSVRLLWARPPTACRLAVECPSGEEGTSGWTVRVEGLRSDCKSSLFR